MRAAAIRIQRPVERHAFDGIERGAAGHFLIGRAVGRMRGVGQRLDGAALLYSIRDVPRRGFRRAEFKEEGIDFHGSDFRFFFLFYLLSPVIQQVGEGPIERDRRAVHPSLALDPARGSPSRTGLSFGR